MSFAELLKNARSQASEISKLQKSAAALVKKEEIKPEELPVENKVDIQKKAEDKTEIKQEPNTHTIGQAIILFANNGLKNSRKLKTTNKCKRIAKNFIKGECTSEHLVKAHTHLQKLKSSNHGDFNLCGGWATVQFFEMLKQNIDPNVILKSTFKGPE
jgi:hypothetical protein